MYENPQKGQKLPQELVTTGQAEHGDDELAFEEEMISLGRSAVLSIALKLKFHGENVYINAIRDEERLVDEGTLLNFSPPIKQILLGFGQLEKRFQQEDVIPTPSDTPQE